MKFSDKQVYEAAVKAVQEKSEDYVYPQENGECVYAVNGKPSCLIGHIVHILDADLFEKLEAEDVQRHREAEHTTCDEMTCLESVFTEAQIVALNRAQICQDQGYSWGTAFLEFSVLDMRDDTREP